MTGTAKRHYERAAQLLRAHENEAERRFAAQLLVQLFTDDNPRFDRERFLAACEPKES